MAGLPRAPRLREALLDLLFPRWCLGCGKGGSFICSGCSRTLPQITPPVCPRCGMPRSALAPCPACHDREFAIDGIRSAFRFEGLVRQTVHEFKYRNLRSLSQPLAGMTDDCLTANHLPGEVLVPVPLHPKRLRERGYNQSALLAEEIGRLSGLPVASHSLSRTRHTPPQAKTGTVEERRANMKGVFSCRDRSLAGRQVILIDDVTTSGATLDACAGALKAAGAASVWGLTLAREV